MRPWLAPLVASVGFAALVVVFAIELRSFRRAVEDWAGRDLEARTELAAANLREPLRTGDFKTLYAFGTSCENEGLDLIVFSPGGGIFYAMSKQSQGMQRDKDAIVYATAHADEFTVRLGLPRERVLAPFRKARLGFLLAALLGGAGMLLVFGFTYRQHVRIRELARLERFRREFIADVSHELKTPLTGILGAVDLLDSRHASQSCCRTLVVPDPNPDDTLLALIKREAKRLDTLAQGILDLARLERADEAVSKAPTDLDELVRDVVASFAPQAETQGVRIRVAEGTKDMQGAKIVLCDPQLISRAVSNLVGNALRHSGTPDIIVSVAYDHGAEITVEDHGKGIPAEEASRVFERFHRVDPSRTASTGGAGLGLAIVRRIARLHGGNVTLAPAVPSGCRFTLSLPV